jgi:hypothetical protein
VRARVIIVVALAGLAAIAVGRAAWGLRSASVRRIAGPTLLDEILPEFEFSSVYSTTTAADAGTTYRAAIELPAEDLGTLARALLAGRGLPARLVGAGDEQPLTGTRPLLEAMGDLGFRILGTEPDREVVFGDVGRFWSVRDIAGPAIGSTREFIDFDDPGYAKVAANVVVRPAPEPGRTILQTETRVHVPDPGVRRRFAAYWLVIEGGSGFIRRRWLGAIARRAERSRRSAGGLSRSPRGCTSRTHVARGRHDPDLAQVSAADRGFPGSAQDVRLRMRG